MVRLTALLTLALVSRPAQAGPDDVFDRALRSLGGDDLVVFPAPGSDGAVRVSAQVRATPGAIRAVLASPPSYREAVPALERAEIIGRRPARTGGDDLHAAWELEIPLFNLEGKLWVVAAGASQVEMILSEGHLAPGRLLWTWKPIDAQTTALTLEARFNVRAGGWVLKRVATSSGHAEPAISAAAAWVALRAIAARAEHPASVSARRPQSPPAPPPPTVLDGQALAAATMTAVRDRGGVTAVVRRATSGRLAAAIVAVPMAIPPAELTVKLATPDSWRGFPGWKRIMRVPGPPGAATVDADVRDSLPFVDLDARWRLATRPAIRAHAIDGATRGALFEWDVFPETSGATTSSLAVLALYPRLEAAGIVPRKFVAAEPLLEHGLALALAYVNAVSMKASLEAARPTPSAPPAAHKPQVPAP